MCKHINMLIRFHCYVILFKGTTDSWGNMFISLSAVYICGGVVYVLLGSSDELPWYSQAKQSEKTPEIPTISQIVIHKINEKSEYGHWNGREFSYNIENTMLFQLLSLPTCIQKRYMYALNLFIKTICLCES